MEPAAALMTMPLILGWEEWVALPGLSLPALRAKIDTGAKTSALHAVEVERFGSAELPFVRFSVHPVPDRVDLAVRCEAPLIDERQVASSNGEVETRAVIETLIAIGGRMWTIEVTLTDRANMKSRMLIGRQAIRDGVLVDPGASFRQPRLSYRMYDTR